MPALDDAEVLGRIAKDATGRRIRALEGISKAIQSTYLDGKGEKVTVISSGPMTNIALFVSVYPELLAGVEQFVFMGGAVGLGNRSAVAGKSTLYPNTLLRLTCCCISSEYNIMCDRKLQLIYPDIFVVSPSNSTCSSDRHRQVRRAKSWFSVY